MYKSIPFEVSLVTLLIGAIIWYFAFSHSLENKRFQQPDFNHYFAAAEALRAGVNPYLPRIDSVGQTNLPPACTTGITPTSAAIFMPLTYFDQQMAWILFQSLFFLTGVATVLMLLSISPIKGDLVSSALFATTFFYSAPFISIVGNSQLQSLLLFLVALSLICFRSRFQMFGWFLIGLTVSVKFFTWPLLAVALIQKDLRGLGAGVIGFILPWVVLEIWIPGSLAMSWIHDGASVLVTAGITMPGNFSLARTVTDFLIPAPSVDAFRFIQAALMAGFGLLGFVFVKKLRTLSTVTLVILAYGLAPILSPTAWPSYFIFTLVLVVAVIQKLPSQWLRWSFGVITFLLLSPLFLRLDSHFYLGLRWIPSAISLLLCWMYLSVPARSHERS